MQRHNRDGQRPGQPRRLGRSERESRPPLPRPDREHRPPPGLDRAADEPDPPAIEPRDVPRAVRAELKGLPTELAEIVAAHLVAAGSLIEEDPELAYRHAAAARRRVARLPLVREAAAETAYAAGRYETARNEFRALRRMTGSADLVPVLADCERALGAPERALALVAEAEPLITDPAMRIELRLVQAGARADLGQRAEALRLLAHEIDNPVGTVPRPAQARLRYAYASLLLAGGDEAAARRWFVAAAQKDPDETDALDRLDEIDGVVLIAAYDQLTDSDGNLAPPTETEEVRSTRSSSGTDDDA